MKKIIGLAAATLVMAAMNSAHAVPTLKLKIDTAASSGDYTTFGGTVLSSSSCEWTTTSGLISVVSGGGYGFVDNLAVVVGKGAPAQPMPALWIQSFLNTSQAGSMTISLLAFDYDLPLSTFPLASFSTLANDPDVSSSLSAYVDVTNAAASLGAGLGYGLGSLVSSLSGGAGGHSLNVQVPVTYSGAYSLSWIMNLTVSNPIGVVTFDGDGTYSQAAPAPGALALIGFGLLGLGALRRRVK